MKRVNLLATTEANGKHTKETRVGIYSFLLLLMIGLLSLSSFGCAAKKPTQIVNNHISYKITGMNSFKREIYKFSQPFIYHGTLDGYHLFYIATKSKDNRPFLGFFAVNDSDCDVCEPVYQSEDKPMIFNPDLLKRPVQIINGKCKVLCLKDFYNTK